jgi:YtkA-like
VPPALVPYHRVRRHLPRIIATTLIAIGLIYGASFVWHKTAARTITSPPFATQTVNDLTVQLSSPGGQPRKGDNHVLIEFRDSGGNLVDVGNVKFELNMNMPGMQMHEGATIQSAGAPGRYRAKIKVGMAGDWTGKISYEGPRGSGRTSFSLDTKP